MKVDAVVFIDTNQYLYFYGVSKGKKLLDTLKEQKDYIFVTTQVVDEVQRNKLSVTAQFLSQELEKLTVRGIDVPDHLLDISGETAAKLRDKLRDNDQRSKEIKDALKDAAVRTLQLISQSEDEVSKALAAVFNKAVPHTPEEIQRARERQERGNPPGKKSDPLRDQLSWEQLLNYCRGKSKL